MNKKLSYQPQIEDSLANENPVQELLERPRKKGKILLLIPSQSHLYGKTILPPYPHLGVLWVAALLEKAGHTISIIDIDLEKKPLSLLLESIKKNSFDIIGLTASTPTYPQAYKLAKNIKKISEKIPIVLGGIHATISPFTCARDRVFDFIIVGEGECTMLELTDYLLNKNQELSKIKGLVYKDKNQQIQITASRPLIKNLDWYPLPSRHLIPNIHKYAPPYASRFPVFSLMASRGCPGTCTYCQTKNIFGKIVRFCTPENVVKEIRELVTKYKAQEIHFLDDVLTINKDFIYEFCALLKKEPYQIDLKVANGLRIDMVNEKILTALHEVGLKNASFGVETGSERVSTLIKKKLNKQQIKETFALAKKIGLETWGFFMIGLLGDNEKSIRETINFAIELDPKFAKFLILTPYPGSEIYEELDKKNLIDIKDFSQYGIYTAPVHHLEELSRKEILKLKKMAFRRFYLRPKKIFQYLKDIKSLKQLFSLIRGFIFILSQIIKK